MRRLRRICRGRSGIRGSREEQMDGTVGQAGAQHGALYKRDASQRDGPGTIRDWFGRELELARQPKPCGWRVARSW